MLLLKSLLQRNYGFQYCSNFKISCKNTIIEYVLNRDMDKMVSKTTENRQIRQYNI